MCSTVVLPCSIKSGKYRRPRTGNAIKNSVKCFLKLYANGLNMFVSYRRYVTLSQKYIYEDIKGAQWCGGGDGNSSSSGRSSSDSSSKSSSRIREDPLEADINI
jgi:hypothetical protein